MLPSQETSIAEALGFRGWEPTGFHPMFYKSIQDLYGIGHEICPFVIRGDYVERARCNLFGKWLKEWNDGNKYDYFFTLDTDVSFDPSAIQSMIDADKQIIGAVCAYKSDGINKGKTPCKFLPGEAPDDNGILKVRWLNGGFGLIRADALLHMVESYPELKYQRLPEMEDGNLDVSESYALWLSKIHTLETGEKAFLSEDYAFYQRAIEVGIDSYLDLKIRLGHWKDTRCYNVHYNPTDPDEDTLSEPEEAPIAA